MDVKRTTDRGSAKYGYMKHDTEYFLQRVSFYARLHITADADAFINDPSIFWVESEDVKETSSKAWEIHMGLGAL